MKYSPALIEKLANPRPRRMSPDEIIRRYAPAVASANVKKRGSVSKSSRVNVAIRICKVDNEKHIVTGEVYSPMVIDSHGDIMLPEDLEQLAHDFMAKKLSDRIDTMHNNKPILANAVESYIARGHPDYSEGAWVLSVKIHDPNIWAKIKSGDYNGYSMEILARRVPAVVELLIQNQVFGVTANSNGHNHVYCVEINDMGRVVSGHTSVDDGHFHKIVYGTATEDTEDHSHRYSLPGVEDDAGNVEES